MTHWLYDWIDSHDIRNGAQAQAAATNPKSLISLYHLASRATSDTTSPIEETDSIVAGEGIDLGSSYSCFHPACADNLIRQIFSRIALYFDHVVIADPFLESLRTDSDAFERHIKDERFASFVELLLHLRNVGAEPYLRFQEKPSLKQDGIDSRLQALNLESRKSDLQHLPSAIIDDCKIDIMRASDGAVAMEVRHPDILTAIRIRRRAGAAPRSEDELREEAVQSVAGILVSTLLGDLSAARKIGAPLGVCASVHQNFLCSNEHTSPTDVAFQLRLPTLDNIPTSELLQVRTDNADAFRQFKNALRKAIAERCKSSQLESPSRISDEIYKDLIRPELERIEHRLRSAESALKKKAMFAVGLGTIATTCGAIVGIPIETVFGGALAGMLGLTGAAGSKHIDDVEQVKQSDMYYVLQLAKRRARTDTG